MSLPDSLDYVQTYTDLAEVVQQETEELKTQASNEVSYDPKSGFVNCEFSDGTTK